MKKRLFFIYPDLFITRLRQWNRRKNYYLKQVKINARLYIAKMLWDNRKKKAIDLTSVKTILLLRNEGKIGDLVVSTPLIKCLYEAGYSVDLLLTKATSMVIKDNPCIRNVYEAEESTNECFLKGFNHNVAKSVVKVLKENNYDLIIDLCLFETPVHRIRLLRQINARFAIGLNKKNFINHYNHTIAFNVEEKHVTNAFCLITDFLNINAIDPVAYHLPIPGIVLSEVKHFLKDMKHATKVIVNAFAGCPERNFSQKQLSDIINRINQNSSGIRFIVLDHRRELTIPLPDNAVINPFSTLHHMMALIHEADIVISPDTAVVHISAAWKKRLISVYKQVSDNNNLWAPGYENASQIIVPNPIISDAEHVPEKILQEINRRELLGNNEAQRWIAESQNT